jgi:hypothetical protein
MTTTTDRTWSAYEACKALRVSYRMLDYWCRTGTVTPSIEAQGSGTQRRFTRDDLERVAFVSILREYGIELIWIRRERARWEAWLEQSEYDITPFTCNARVERVFGDEPHLTVPRDAIARVLAPVVGAGDDQ